MAQIIQDVAMSTQIGIDWEDKKRTIGFVGLQDILVQFVWCDKSNRLSRITPG